MSSLIVTDDNGSLTLLDTNTHNTTQFNKCKGYTDDQIAVSNTIINNDAKSIKDSVKELSKTVSDGTLAINKANNERFDKIESRIDTRDFEYILAPQGKSCPSGYDHVVERNECKEFVRQLEKTGVSSAHSYGDFNNTAWNHHAYGCFTNNDGHNRVHFNNSNVSKQVPASVEQMVCKRK